MVRRAEGTHAYQTGAGIEHAGDAVNFGRLERFLKCEGWQNGRHPLGEHRLARAWRADHQDVVPGTADLQCALGRLLAANAFEVNRVMLRLAQQRVAVNLDRRDAIARVHEMNDVEK